MRFKAEVDAGEARMEKFDWTRSDLPKSGSRKSAVNPVPGLFAGASHETPSVHETLTKECPVHKLDKSCVKSLRNCPLSRKRNSLRNINFACLVCCLAIG